jgi:hypothetical protein
LIGLFIFETAVWAVHMAVLRSLLVRVSSGIQIEEINGQIIRNSAKENDLNDLGVSIFAVA